MAGYGLHFHQRASDLVNLNKIKGWEEIGLSVGTEVELSCNFVAKGFHAMPTLAAKWTF